MCYKHFGNSFHFDIFNYMIIDHSLDKKIVKWASCKIIHSMSYNNFDKGFRKLALND